MEKSDNFVVGKISLEPGIEETIDERIHGHSHIVEQIRYAKKQTCLRRLRMFQRRRDVPDEVEYLVWRHAEEEGDNDTSEDTADPFFFPRPVVGIVAGLWATCKRAQYATMHEENTRAWRKVSKHEERSAVHQLPVHARACPDLNPVLVAVVDVAVMCDFYGDDVWCDENETGEPHDGESKDGVMSPPRGGVGV